MRINIGDQVRGEGLQPAQKHDQISTGRLLPSKADITIQEETSWGRWAWSSLGKSGSSQHVCYLRCESFAAGNFPATASANRERMYSEVSGGPNRPEEYSVFASGIK